MNKSNLHIKRSPQHLIGMVLLLLGMFVLLVAGAAGAGRETAVTDNIHPALLAMAAEQPETAVRVIIQKSDPTADIEGTITQLGGSVIQDLHIINALVARIPANVVPQLAQSRGVRWVSLDGLVESSGKPPGGSPSPQCGYDTASNTMFANCYPGTLNLQAVWNMGITGSGIGVAVIDSGIAPDADFGSRVRRSVSFNTNSTRTSDVFGHGTHVAGIIGGSGADSAGLYKGVAPNVNLISLKISDETGLAYESDTVAAMQWVLDNKDAYNIRVVNMSINSANEQSYHTSPMDAAAEILWFNKIVVVASSGNKGSGGLFNTTNAAPANDPFIITVGGTHEHNTFDYKDDTLAAFTAYGTTVEGFFKPDILAPGQDIASVLAKQSQWNIQAPDRLAGNGEYFRISGTSMAAPLVSGAAALILQNEPNLTPDQVKYRLTHATSRSISWTDGQGKNAIVYSIPYLDVYAAVTNRTTQSANTGLAASQLLWTGSNPVNWNSVNWGSVNWGSVNWGSVNWGSVNWGSVNWGSVSWEN